MKTRTYYYFVFLTVLITLTTGLTGKIKPSPENFDKYARSLIKRSIPIIKPTELAGEIAIKKNILILDTRELVEFKVSRIPGAQYVGYKTFDLDKMSEVPKDAPIIVYCSLGARSEIIGLKLKQAGFDNVKNLYGGIFNWVNKGFGVVNQKNKHTFKIHAYSTKWGKWLFKGKKVY